MSMESAAKKFTETVLNNKGAVVASLGKPHACDNCRRRITATQSTVVWLEQSQKICPACALIFLKRGGLLARVEERSPPCGYGDRAVLAMMKSSPLGRLAIIPHVSEVLITNPTRRWYNQLIVELNKTQLAVLAMLFKSVVHGGEDLQSSLIRLLTASVLRDLLKQQPSLANGVQQVVRGEDRELQLGVLQMLPSFAWKRSEKLTLIAAIKEGDDSAIAEAIQTNLKKIGIHDKTELDNVLKYQPAADLLMNSYKPEVIRSLHRFIFRYIPGGSTTKDCSVLALEIVQATSERADIERFYQSLPDSIQKLICLLLWRRVPPDSDEIESALGLRTVRLKDIGGWRDDYYIEVTKEYSGLLSLLKLGGQRAGVVIVSWLDRQFKKVLPKPEGATLRSSGATPNISDSGILRHDPDFVALLPNLYDRLRDGSITLKKNGLPTIAGCRQMAASSGGYTEFYPEDRALRSLRSELLFRMFDQIEISSDLEMTAPLVVRTLLDSVFSPTSELDADFPYATKYANSSFVCRLLTHLEWHYRGSDEDLEFEYLSSLRHLMATLPKDHWITVGQALDYLYLNDRELGSTAIAKMAQAIIPNTWGSKNYLSLNQANVMHYWEEPLLKTLILLLASVSAVEVLYGEPRNAARCTYNKPYISWADGVNAFRLSPLGHWYFQDGDENCFKKLERGQIVLDQNRLLLQLQGNDIALKAALEQITRVVGNNFYSVDSASFLKECRSEEAVFQKINAFKALLPDELPQVWQNFFKTTSARLNPLEIVTPKYTVLKLKESPELKQLLVSNRKLRMFTTLAEGGLILVSHKNLRLFKKALADLGFFVSGF